MELVNHEASYDEIKLVTWAGHVARMVDTRDAYRSFAGKSEREAPLTNI
jgi:hypothetical protein